MNKDEKAEKTKGRSPSYPGLDIESALMRTRELYAKVRKHETNVVIAVGHWGYKFGTGQSNITLASLKKYGLMEESGSGENRKIWVTELAERIIIDDRPESDERDKSIIKAALSPKIHERLYEKYGSELPPNENLIFDLRTDLKFTESGARELVLQYRRTLAFIEKLKSDVILPENVDKGQGSGEIKPPFVPPPKGGFKPPTPPKGENMKNVEIPIAIHPWPVLTVRFPMPKAMWDQMMVMLKAMESAIVESEEAKENLSTGEENPE